MSQNFLSHDNGANNQTWTSLGFQTPCEEIFGSKKPTQKTFWAGIWKTRVSGGFFVHHVLFHIPTPMPQPAVADLSSLPKFQSNHDKVGMEVLQ